MKGAASIDPSRLRRLTPRAREDVEAASVLAIMVSSPLRFFSFAGVLSSHFAVSMGLGAPLRRRHRRPQIALRVWEVQGPRSRARRGRWKRRKAQLVTGRGVSP